MATLAFDNLMKVILVIVLVVIIIVFTRSSAFAIVKNVLKITGEEKEEVTQEQALVNFQDLVKMYNNCFKSDKQDCVCFQFNFPKFPSDSSLGFYSNPEIGLRQITLFGKEDKEIVTANLEGDFGCRIYYSFQRFPDGEGNYPYRLEPALSMKFDKDKKYLIDTKDKIGDLPNEFPFLYKTKDGKVCFVTEDTIATSKFNVYSGEKRLKEIFRDYLSSRPVCS